MPIIERPNRDALRRGIDIYIDTMREFIVNAIDRSSHITLPVQNQIYQDLENSHQVRFWAQLSKNNRCVESAIDIADFKRLIAKNWFAIFDDIIEGDRDTIFNLLSRITNARNQASHFSKSDLDLQVTLSRLGDITGVMRRIGAKNEESVLVDIRRHLMSDASESLQHCDFSLRGYFGLLASRRRTRHANGPKLFDNNIDAHLNGYICTQPYNALTFSRVQMKNQTCHRCRVSQH